MGSTPISPAQQKRKDTKMITIERYAAFVCDEYEGECGWRDFFAASDDLEELKKKVEEKIAGRERYYWYHIMDLSTKESVSGFGN